MFLSKIKSYRKFKINYFLKHLCGLFIILCFFLSIKLKPPSLGKLSAEFIWHKQVFIPLPHGKKKDNLSELS